MKRAVEIFLPGRDAAGAICSIGPFGPATRNSPGELIGKDYPGFLLIFLFLLNYLPPGPECSK